MTQVRGNLPAWRGALAEYLSSCPQVELAFLFGFQARGTARAGSDVDLAVFLREPYGENEVRKLWNSVEDLLRRDVDMVVLNQAPPGISWTAFQGDALVNKDPRLYVEKMLEFSREAEDMRDFIFELADLPQFGGMSQEEYIADRNRRRNLERLAENVVNAAVDIAKVILSGEPLPIPDTYRETILLLHQAGVLEKTIALQMAE